MILHLYCARRFSMAFLFVTGAFSVLIVLLDFIEQLRRFRGHDVAFGKILHLVTLNVPATLYQMLPLIMVLCSILLYWFSTQLLRPHKKNMKYYLPAFLANESVQYHYQQTACGFGRATMRHKQ